MLSFFKFRQDLFDPIPAKDVYIKRKPGKGWPEECPPVRTANSFGIDVLANFDLTFVQKRGQWSVVKDIVIESDFNYAGSEDSPGEPLLQQYAWFWEKGQKIPHVISDNVYREISNQSKISSFLFLKTDPNELLMIAPVPNYPRQGWRPMSAVIETDWYPASYPWHIAIELDRAQTRVSIKKGEPLCRLIPLRRDAYFAQQMSQEKFGEFFARGQKWLSTHGKFEHEGDAAVADITKTYMKQQAKAKFLVMT